MGTGLFFAKALQWFLIRLSSQLFFLKNPQPVSFENGIGRAVDLFAAAGSKQLDIGLVVLTPFLTFALPFLLFFFVALRSYRNYTKSNTYKSLMGLGYGSSGSVEKFISDDIANNAIGSDKRMVLSRNWIVLRYVLR